jgi:hypothetical protein
MPVSRRRLFCLHRPLQWSLRPGLRHVAEHLPDALGVSHCRASLTSAHYEYAHECERTAEHLLRESLRQSLTAWS